MPFIVQPGYKVGSSFSNASDFCFNALTSGISIMYFISSFAIP